jgi:glycosyltransferase involved in cell wall biosynthesis
MVTPSEAVTAFGRSLGPMPESAEVVGAPLNETGFEQLAMRSPSLTERLYRERQRAACATAQADRFRQCAIVMAAEAAALRSRLDSLESSTLWRAMAPVRRLGSAMPPELRRLLRRTGYLLWWGVTLQLPSRWRAWQASRTSARNPSENGIDRKSPRSLTDAKPIDHAPVALIIDNCWPQPDRDSGSVDTINMVDSLLEIGFRVIFAADLEFGATASSLEALLRRRVHCLQPPQAPSIMDFLEQEGVRIDLCILSRIFGGGRFFEAVQRSRGMPRIVFNPVDLHFLRQEREARLRGDAEGVTLAETTRKREEQLVRETDATIVVSAAERSLLADSVPDAYVVQLPLAREIRPPKTPFEARSGIGFIAGFSHLPNVDALQFFLAQIWPLVIDNLTDCEFAIVGPDLPGGMLENVPGTVRYLGHLPEIWDWLESLRLTAAPLRYGAGAKGKVASSLAAGLPCVTTSVGAEGMELQHGVNVLIADSPRDFAAQIVRAYTDPILWSLISAGAQQHAEKKLSIANWRRLFREMVWTIGATPALEVIGDDRELILSN